MHVDGSFNGLTTLCLLLGDVCCAPARARVDAIGIDFQRRRVRVGSLSASRCADDPSFQYASSVAQSGPSIASPNAGVLWTTTPVTRLGYLSIKRCPMGPPKSITYIAKRLAPSLSISASTT